jgi:hypothetical protein
MESLVTYKLLLLKGHLPTDSRERIDVTNQCLRLLKELEEADPMRRQRYRDIGACDISVGILDVILVISRRTTKCMMRNRAHLRWVSHLHISRARNAKPRHETALIK